ncbi:MAG: Adaptive-response sensory-kinase SasA [Phycisphaerae bacterium]|nr:Adaptive-response sensory-kinase SasA [Phycisphaerae bacterium]
MVFLLLTAQSAAWTQLSPFGALLSGTAVALIIALLLYAVIRWDEDYRREETEKRQLGNVVDHSTDAIVISTATGHILYANHSAQRAFGFSETPSGHENLTRIGLTVDDRDRLITTITQNEQWSGEITQRLENGHERIHLVTLFQLKSFRQHSPAIVCIGRDLTHRKQLEQRVRQSEKLAAIGELAAGVAHEINNPMAAIASQVGLAKDLILLPESLSQHQSEVLECINEVSQQVHQCSQIVESLLRLSRRQPAVLTPINVNEAIQQAIRFVTSLSKMKQLEIKFQPWPIPLTIHSDSGSISQILVNLLVNAADATEQRGPIAVEFRNELNWLHIDVIDYGCGIPRQYLSRVFEPFFSTKPPGQGTGLGLSISYGIAQTLGGELTLCCPSPGGTRATLSLPNLSNAAVADSSANPVQHAAPLHSAMY